MWNANPDAHQAGFGHRRQAERVAADARDAVNQAQAAIADVHAGGAPLNEHLDKLERRAAELRARVEPIHGLDTIDRNEIRQLDQMLHAADTYTGWLEGRPTSMARLAHAVDTLTAAARTAPAFARHPGEVDQTQWYQLLDLAPRHDLEQERSAPEFQLGR
jgi:hypothetical protein